MQLKPALTVLTLLGGCATGISVQARDGQAVSDLGVRALDAAAVDAVTDAATDSRGLDDSGADGHADLGGQPDSDATPGVDATAAVDDEVTIGAIRWDAWNGDTSSSTTPYAQILHSLQPAKWAERYPFYATTDLDGNLVSASSATQSITDQEIDFAHDAGLNYWAFLSYGPHSGTEPLMRPFELYHSSAKKSKLKFCLILHRLPATIAQWEAYVADSLMGWLLDPHYQTVLGARPLLYVFPADQLKETYGSWANAKSAVDHLRARAVAAGVEDPYLVAMHWDTAVSVEAVDEMGLDAISAYTAHTKIGAQEEPYATLISQNQTRWNVWKQTGKAVVPTVNAGWDNRPIDERPTSWYTPDDDTWFGQPTPAELRENTQNAVSFVRRNPSACRANTLIVFAWNEFAEGGYICPTKGGGAARLNALLEVDRSSPLNIVENPGFGDSSHWQSYEDSAVAASFSVEEGWASVAIERGGENASHIQLYQAIDLKKGRKYAIRFKARAAGVRRLTVSIHRHTSPWTRYWTETVDLTTAAQTFGPYEFVSDTTSGDRRINFMSGGNAHDVWIDDVEVAAQ